MCNITLNVRLTWSLCFNKHLPFSFFSPGESSCQPGTTDPYTSAHNLSFTFLSQYSLNCKSYKAGRFCTSHISRSQSIAAILANYGSPNTTVNNAGSFATATEMCLVCALPFKLTVSIVVTSGEPLWRGGENGPIDHIFLAATKKWIMCGLP